MCNQIYTYVLHVVEQTTCNAWAGYEHFSVTGDYQKEALRFNLCVCACMRLCVCVCVRACVCVCVCMLRVWILCMCFSVSSEL